MTKEEIKAEEPKVVEEKATEETVPVKRSTLEKMLDRIDRLEFAASKAQLAHFDAKSKQDGTKEASISVYNDKIVTAWKMVEDLVEKINGVWVEKQTLEITYIDDEKERIPAKTFWLQHQKKLVQVLSEKKLVGGQIIWEVETIETGLGEPVKVSLDIVFIN